MLRVLCRLPPPAGMRAAMIPLKPSAPRPQRALSTRGGGDDVAGKAREPLIVGAMPPPFWLPSTSLMLALLAATAAYVALSLQTELTVWNSEAVRARAETTAILAAHAPPPAADDLGEYVPRPELEGALEAFLREPASKAGQYLVVHGASGAGKSTLVSHVLSKKGGGVVVVRAAGTPLLAAVSDLDVLVLDKAVKHSAVRRKVTYVPSHASAGQLADRLDAAARTYRHDHPDEPGWRPIVVFELDCPADTRLVGSVCTHLKQLAHDKPLCHGILVLRDPAALAALPDDRARQQFLHVGPFSRAEVSAALGALFEQLPEEEAATDAAVAEVKERALALTTLPSFVSALAERLRGSASEAELRDACTQWAGELEAAAWRDIRGALTLDAPAAEEGGAREGRVLPVRELMLEILDADGPVRLPTSKCFAEAGALAAKLRGSKAASAAFEVDLVAGTVDFASGAHRKAAAEFFPAPQL